MTAENTTTTYLVMCTGPMFDDRDAIVGSQTITIGRYANREEAEKLCDSYNEVAYMVGDGERFFIKED